MTVAEAVAAATRRLAAAGVPEPGRDARRLVAHALGIGTDRLTLVAHDEARAPELDGLVARRIARQPVAQIVGWRAFWGRRFRVTADVLDPRPETETLVAVGLGRPFANVFDLGTGSGCVLLSLMAERTGVAGTGTDISQAALAVARENAAALGLAPDLVVADWFDGIAGRWDLIVSNPPYIGAAEMPSLGPDLAWEPQGALSPGVDGLAAYRRIAAGAARHLTPGGTIALEVGATQAAAVAALLAGGGLADIALHPDLDGRDRVVSARAPG